MSNWHTVENMQYKWCPESRPYGSNGSYNRVNREGRSNRPTGDSLCIAVGCAKWLWKDDEEILGRCGAVILIESQIEEIIKKTITSTLGKRKVEV